METAVGCVVLAAGNAARFGENKLFARLEGKTLLERALEAVPAEECGSVAVVTRFPEAEELCRRFGFGVVRNDRPDLGQSRSVRLGLEAVGRECAAVVFLAADQPWLRRESVAELIRFWRKQPEKIAAVSHGGVRGSPCLFPAKFYPELLSLAGDTGGSAVIRRHGEELALLEIPARELWDVDTPEALYLK